jgi:spoIIIJ-associated protein
MERATLEIIAPSVDEAIARGTAQLGVSREMVDVDVLDEGAKGFLGFGSRQVRVRLTLKSFEESAPEPVKAAPVEPTPTAPASNDDPILEIAESFTRELLEKLKVNAKVKASYAEKDEDGEVPVLVDIRGDDLSILIGRRAETLNALQYIIGLVVSKKSAHWTQVIADVEGYRARREKQLRQLARRMSEQALRTGKRQVLEPMSSAERRIIHLELRNSPDVETQSIGEEPNRKVTIVLKK